MYWEDIPITRRGQETTYISARNIPIPEKSLMISTVWDVTGRKKTEEKLRKGEERFRFLAENMADIIWTSDLHGDIGYVSSSIRGILGFSPEEKKDRNLRTMVAPDSLRTIERLLSGDYRRVLENMPDAGRPVIIEAEFYHKNGGTIWLESTLKWIRGQKGSLTGILGVSRDISERRKAEAEREKLQQQLLQAQKMESVGRLAGGVAHDFNNMLSVIMGYTEMALEKVRPSDPLHADLSEINMAGRRSMEITRQLLAFARRQTIDPRVVDLNEVVEGMLKMLRRLIGEDIDLIWHPGRQLWPVKLDPAQVDQILANLCINARDAIDGAGRIIIETGNISLDAASCRVQAGIPAGDFVLLTVADDGSGMDAETLENIFDPFFTTKGVHEGTGLGLATVYGIVRQNNGFVDVDSEPGKGTTFRIYLPRDASGQPQGETENITRAPEGRGETVLLVEDEPAIMRMGEVVLTGLGYQVFAAGTPDLAMELAQEHAGAIDLLVTDVILPGRNGWTLSKEVRRLCPGLKTLFMSGYTAEVIARRGVLDPDVNFLQKPFTLHELGSKVHEVLKKR